MPRVPAQGMDMRIKTLEFDKYLERLLYAPRPGADNILAYYDHRIGFIGRDPRLLFVPADDRLVHRGDGVFETLKYKDGRIYQLQAHLDRMKRSAAGIYMDLAVPIEELYGMILDLARASGEKTGLIRLLAGRGMGGFGVDPAEAKSPSLYMIAYRSHPRPESFFEKGASACRTSIQAKPGYMARIKTVNYIPNVLMKREACLKNCDFPVCFDENDFMAEGAVENICMVDKNGLLIMPNFEFSLPGTSILRAAELIRNEIHVGYQPVTEDDLYEAREIIAVGTTIDAVGVVKYNDRMVADGKPGPVARRMRELLMKDFAENGVSFTS